MHPVGTCRDREVGAVIDHKKRAVPVGGSPKFAAPAENVAGLGILLAQLHDVDARREDRIKKRAQIALSLSGAGTT